MTLKMTSLLLDDCHARILKTDGKETQGKIISADDQLVMIESNTTKRIIPWTSIVSLTKITNSETTPDAPRTP